MNKQPEVTKQTMENLENAFWKIYAQKGIDKIAVKEITDTAGYNRGTFYLYYKDIYHMLDKIEMRILEDMTNEHPGKFNHGKEQECCNEDTVELIDKISETYNKYKKYLDVLFGEHGDPGFIEKWKTQMKADLRPKLVDTELFEERIIDYVLEYHVTGSIALVRYCFTQKNPLPIEDMIHFMKSFETFYESLRREYIEQPKERRNKNSIS